MSSWVGTGACPGLGGSEGWIGECFGVGELLVCEGGMGDRELLDDFDSVCPGTAPDVLQGACLRVAVARRPPNPMGIPQSQKNAGQAGSPIIAWELWPLKSPRLPCGHDAQRPLRLRPPTAHPPSRTSPGPPPSCPPRKARCPPAAAAPPPPAAPQTACRACPAPGRVTVGMRGRVGGTGGWVGGHRSMGQTGSVVKETAGGDAWWCIE
jgi:hypothetical protein